MDNKNYRANDIKTLDFKEHVWLRPKLYFQTCFDDNNLNSLALEAFCPAIDEYFDGNCSLLSLSINKNMFKIQYNAGMALTESHGVTIAELFMTKLMACKNEKKHLKVGEEFCHLGMATINAVAEKCELNISWNKQKGHFIFENGETIIREISYTDIEKNYTEMGFQMSKKIFGNLEFNFDDLQQKLNLLRKKLPNLKLELNKL